VFIKTGGLSELCSGFIEAGGRQAEEQVVMRSIRH